MDDDGPVAEERADAGLRGGVEVEVRGLEGARGDVAVLAAQVADLAGRWMSGITRRRLATNEGVEVSKGAGTVAVGGDREGVDVVDEGTEGCFAWETKEINIPRYSGSIAVGSSGDLSTNPSSIAIRQDRLIGSTDRKTRGDDGVAKLASDLRGSKGDAGNSGDDV